MAYEFINTRTGKTQTVYNVREAKKYDRLDHYQRVDAHVCVDCGRTFDSPQGLASHSRVHQED